jgi:hypothetical protein
MRSTILTIIFIFLYIFPLAFWGCGSGDTGHRIVLGTAVILGTPIRIIEDIKQAEYERKRDALTEANFVIDNCPDSFSSFCRAFQGAIIPEPFDSYKKIVEVLNNSPLSESDPRSYNIQKWIYNCFSQSSDLSVVQLESIIEDANRFINSSRPGDGISAAIIIGSLTELFYYHITLIHTEEEWDIILKIANTLVKAYEKVAMDLSNNFFRSIA